MVSRFICTQFHDYEAIHFGCAYKALIVNCIRISIAFKSSNEDYIGGKYHFDGHMWMQDSYATWQERFPYLSLKTIQRTLEALVNSGYLIKHSANSGNGRLPNFYRIDPDQDLYLKVQSMVKSPKVNLSLVGDEPNSQIDQSPLVKLTNAQQSNCPLALLSTNNQAIYQTNKSPALRAVLNTWKDGDEMANVFSNLAKLPACFKKMNTEEFREKLKSIMADFSVTIEELAKSANEWQEHHNEQRKKPTAHMRSFRTWVSNSVKWGTLSEKHKRPGAVQTHTKTNDERPWE